MVIPCSPLNLSVLRAPRAIVAARSKINFDREASGSGLNGLAPVTGHHGKEAIGKDARPQGKIGTDCTSLDADIFNCLWQLGEHDCDRCHIRVGAVVPVGS